MWSQNDEIGNVTINAIICARNSSTRGLWTCRQIRFRSLFTNKQKYKGLQGVEASTGQNPVSSPKRSTILKGQRQNNPYQKNTEKNRRTMQGHLRGRTHGLTYTREVNAGESNQGGARRI